MCALSAQPPIPFFVPWPWQSPIYWLAFTSFSVIVCAVSVLSIFVYRRLKSAVPSITRHLGLARLSLALGFSVTITGLMGAFVVFLMEMPSYERLWAWYEAQYTDLTQRGCLHTALYAAYDPLSQRLHTCLILGGISFAVMALLLILWAIIFVALLIRVGAFGRERSALTGMYSRTPTAR